MQRCRLLALLQLALFQRALHLVDVLHQRTVLIRQRGCLPAALRGQLLSLCQGELLGLQLGLQPGMRRLGLRQGLRTRCQFGLGLGCGVLRLRECLLLGRQRFGQRRGARLQRLGLLRQFLLLAGPLRGLGGLFGLGLLGFSRLLALLQLALLQRALHLVDVLHQRTVLIRQRGCLPAALRGQLLSLCQGELLGLQLGLQPGMRRLGLRQGLRTRCQFGLGLGCGVLRLRECLLLGRQRFGQRRGARLQRLGLLRQFLLLAGPLRGLGLLRIG